MLVSFETPGMPRQLLIWPEWNRNKDRTVNLHRHPCFIGPVESVLHDCCGFCPEPKTDEDHEVAKEESKIYVSGTLVFMKDDPGRQAIGSFNPLTDDDWTDMAYIGDTQELCQRICDGDLDFVREWCEKNPGSIDRRDHTGRTPLHIAAQCSTSEILECLVDHGARIVARLVDGMTALHIAAARGDSEMVSTLLEQSEDNEAEEVEKEERKNRLRYSEVSHCDVSFPSSIIARDQDLESPYPVIEMMFRLFMSLGRDSCDPLPPRKAGDLSWRPGLSAKIVVASSR